VAVARTYAANGLNQYSTAGPASFCYDLNGNLTADGTSVYKYDAENRLIEKRSQVGGACPVTNYTGTLQASLTYDPMGRLWQVTGTSTNNRYLYDGDELVAEYDFAGTMANRYVHSDNVDDPVVLYGSAAVGAANRIYLMPDERGSIAGLFYDNGSIYAKNVYDEYGIPGQFNQGRFQYTGQIWLPELGMYHYKARIYSPTLGRFLQTDPVGYDDQVNLYAYVGNDPINATDPTGELCQMNDEGSKCAWDAVNGELPKGADRMLRAMEYAINAANANPDGLITLGGTDDEGNVKTVTMTGADFVNQATSRDIVYGGPAPLPVTDKNAFDAQTRSDDKGKVTTTFYDRSIEGRTDRQMQQSGGHEFAHHGDAEKRLRGMLNRKDGTIGKHQQYYKDNIREIEKRKRR